jgi:hypothetical protein
MLQIAALVNKIAVGRSSSSRVILRVIPCKQKLAYTTSRLFSSLNSDDQNGTDEVPEKYTKKAKTYQGLTRMRVKKVVKPDIGDFLLVYLYI